MSKAILAHEPLEPESTNEQIDNLCDEFETEWSRQPKPTIEAFLEREPALRSQLLVALVRTEVELRRRDGEAPARDDYLQRFPEDRALIDIPKVWTQGNSGPETLPMPPSAPAEEVPTKVLGLTHYSAVDSFDEGGFGVVCKGHDDDLDRKVVVKFVRNEFVNDERVVDQFWREAEITSRLNHPGVVAVYCKGKIDDSQRPYYAMRLIDGQKISDRITEYHRRLNPPKTAVVRRQQLFELLEHFVDACNTLAYAHGKKIYHCDIKPEHLMIGEYGQTFVIDWGLAVDMSQTNTTTRSQPIPDVLGPRSRRHAGVAIGLTLQYASPEQVRRQSPTARSDVYSLGATLYEILTGRAAFDKTDSEFQRVKGQVLQGKFKPPREVNQAVDPKLEAICLKAMQFRPEDRYAGPEELASDLEKWMRDDEVSVVPDRLSDKARRLVRRNFGASLVAMAAALLLSILGTSTYFSNQNVREKTKVLGMVETNLHGALDAFEDICEPLTYEDKSRLRTFKQVADHIGICASTYLDAQRSGSADMDRADLDRMGLFTGRFFALRATTRAATAMNWSASADADYEDAIKEFESLVNASRHDQKKYDEFTVRLARVRLSRGRQFLESGNLEAAEKELVMVRTTLDTLRARVPNGEVPSHGTRSLNFKRDQAEAYHSLGEVYLRLSGKVADEKRPNSAGGSLLDEALTYFNSADNLLGIPVKGKNWDEQEAGRKCRRDKARTLGWMGDVYLQMGDFKNAQYAYASSIRFRESLYKQDQNNAETRFQYSRGLANFGLLYRDLLEGSTHNVLSAIRHLQEAIGIEKGLVDEFDGSARFQFDLAENQCMLAECCLFAAARTEDKAKSAQWRHTGIAAAGNAVDVYQNMQADSAAAETSQRVHFGLAECHAILALLSAADGDQPAFAEQLKLAAGAVVGHHENDLHAPLDFKQLFVLAMVYGLQAEIPVGQKDGASKAVDVLEAAQQRGLNFIARVDAHRDLAFETIMKSPPLKDRFNRLFGPGTAQSKSD